MEKCQFQTTIIQPIKRVLVSVSDKTGVLEFARALVGRGIELISTGGTARLLKDSGLPVIEVSSYTKFPEIMDGRVKTLHPKVHGGILGRRGQDETVMTDNEILPIDMVVVNLYPFEKSIEREDCTLEEAIENIDIGGPAMIRAAAKNHQHVAVVVTPSHYESIINELDLHENTLTTATLLRLAGEAFKYTASYDNMIANYFASRLPASSRNSTTATCFSPTLKLSMKKKQEMRYGENPHQKAAFYMEENPLDACVTSSVQWQGKPLSYNNIVDADTALECVKTLEEPACVIVKHANPCGVSMGANLAEAYQRALNVDPVSAFGGIIAFNRELDEMTARSIVAQQFVEVIIAPSVTSASLDILANKKNLRLLTCGGWKNSVRRFDFKCVNGGFLVQENDSNTTIDEKQLKVVTKRSPTDQEKLDAIFSWKIAKFVKSNAVVYAQNGMTVGIGAGQMSRVYSTKIATLKAKEAGLLLKGSVMASDAFLPFRDSVDAAAEAGVTCIIQPGGSVRDDEVICAANEHNVAMLFTGIRHFRH